MSVVLCYSCNKFSMIATDTMISFDDGSRTYEPKIYPINQYSFGHCAGVGLGEVIYKIRDNLNSLIEVNFATISDAFRQGYLNSIDDDNKNYVFSTKVAVSIPTIIQNEIKILYNICISEFKEGNFVIEPIQFNNLRILYPKGFNEPCKYNDFINTHDFNCIYNGDFNKFLLYVADMFNDIYQSSKEYVSDTCEITLNYFRCNSQKIEPRQFAVQINTLIENCKQNLYTEIEKDINQQPF